MTRHSWRHPREQICSLRSAPSCFWTHLGSVARAVSTPDESLRVVTLAEALPEMADMRTVVLVGSSATRIIPRAGRPLVYTPRSVPA